jgi:hypothetical protein
MLGKLPSAEEKVKRSLTICTCKDALWSRRRKRNFRKKVSMEICQEGATFEVFKSESILPEPSPAIELRKRKVWSSNDDFSAV